MPKIEVGTSYKNDEYYVSVIINGIVFETKVPNLTVAIDLTMKTARTLGIK